MKHISTTVFIIFCCVASAQSQVDSSFFHGLSLEELQDLQVVSVTRSAQKSNDAPATVRIITAEQIRLRGYQSLLEVLQDLPDVKIETNNDPRWQNDVQIRGVFGMDKFIILLDGVRISSPTNDIIPIMENYPVHFARQIEVVYGPASAVYGADALSGVINLVTRRADDGSFFTGALQGGMFNAYTASFSGGAKLSNQASFTLSGQYFYDQQPLLSAVKDFRVAGKGINDFLSENNFPTDLGFPQSSTQPISTEIENPLSAYAIHGALQISDLRLTVFANYSRNPSTTANKPNNAVYNEDSFFAHRILMSNATYSKFWTSNFNTTSFITYSQYDLDSESSFRNAFTGMNKAFLASHGRLFKVEQLASWTISNRLSISGGITFEDYFAIPRGHDLNAPYNGEREIQPVIVNSIGLPGAPNGIPARIFRLNYENFGGFLQAQISPAAPLIFTLGARIDDDSRFGTLFNPRLGAVYRPSERFTFKALYGRAFLAPSPLSAYDEFGTFFNAGGNTQSAFFRLANPNLGPQKIETFELSARGLLNNEFSITLNGYFNLLDGLFSQVPTGETVYPVAGFNFPISASESIVNQGDQQNYGGTVQIDYVKNFKNDRRVALYAALSYIDGQVQVRTNRGELTDREIGGISTLMLRLGGDISFGKLTVSPRLVALNRQRSHPQQGSAFKRELNQTTNSEFRQTLPGYVLLNMTARYELTRNVTVMIRGFNLFNQTYTTVNLGAAPEGLEGSAANEFANGAPQNPLRIIGGVQVQF